nr:MAG TPA: hypothetical protein [Bacteriophage sp.]
MSPTSYQLLHSAISCIFYRNAQNYFAKLMRPNKINSFL